jgi:4a-hydroxytetrahydrobiopterin dehydratase
MVQVRREQKRNAIMTPEAIQLANMACRACTGSAERLTGPDLTQYAAEVPKWAVVDAQRIERTFKFPDFRSALEFVNRVGELAEREQHHPDIHLSYGKVRVELWTHKVHGLSVNDFILAAKIDRI